MGSENTRTGNEHKSLHFNLNSFYYRPTKSSPSAAATNANNAATATFSGAARSVSATRSPTDASGCATTAGLYGLSFPQKTGS